MRRAFTLIELLVVVAIIALLLSIMLPALGGARQQAQATKCAANLHQIGTAMYCYWTEWNGRVPYVVSPMTNGTGTASSGGVPGFGNKAFPDSAVDPFDREHWPLSLPNILMPKYIGDSEKLFVCPSARVGWPRQGGRLRYTYREASANQPNGPLLRPNEDTYLIETFGFLDGRILRDPRMKLTGNPILDVQQEAMMRGTYLRDLVERDGATIMGPHKGGINVINRRLQVEYRNHKVTAEDLAPGWNSGSTF